MIMLDLLELMEEDFNMKYTVVRTVTSLLQELSVYVTMYTYVILWFAASS